MFRGFNCLRAKSTQELKNMNAFYIWTRQKNVQTFGTLLLQFSFSSDQFSIGVYICAREGPYALDPVSQEFPQMLPLKQFQCCSACTMALSRPLISR